MINNIFIKAYFGYGGHVLKRLPGLFAFILPKTIVVEASNMCMLKCPACATVSSSKRKQGLMPFETFKDLIDNIDWKLKRINFSYAGEPLANPQVLRMVKYAKQRGIDSVIETNGMLLIERVDELLESGLQKLNIAFDGINQEMVSKYRVGIDFEKVISGIQQLVSERKKRGFTYPEIHLQLIVMKHNENAIDKVIKMAQELGADFIDIKSMIIGGGYGLSQKDKDKIAFEYLPERKEFMRYDRHETRWKLKKGRRCFCTHLLSDAVVTWTGDVTICTMDVGGRLVVGNIHKASLRKIWVSKDYNIKRRLAFASALEECKDCDYLVSDFKLIKLR